MNFMDKSVLTAEDICRIMEVSAKAKVSSISYGDLRIVFGEEVKTDASGPSKILEPTPPTEATLSEIGHDKLNKDSLEKEEIKTREDQLDLMFVENPLAAEELLASGDAVEEDLDDGNDGEV